MDIAQQRDLLQLLHILADECRLNLTRLIHQQERTLSEMVELLELSESVVSDHLRQMHTAGLLSLRMRNNQRYYHINPQRLTEFRTYVADIGNPLEERYIAESNSSWIDALDWAEEDKKVLREYIFDGRLTKLPYKMKKEAVIMRWLATHFESGIRYTEHQVNTVLTAIHEDYATLRRGLIEYGYMQRERGGGPYWLTEA